MKMTSKPVVLLRNLRKEIFSMDVRMAHKIMQCVFFLFAFLLAFGAAGGTRNGSDNVPDAREALTFEDVRVSFVNMKDRGATYVITVGVLRNISAREVRNIQVEVRHLDGEKRLVDVHEDYFSAPLKPGEDLAFRIYEFAAQPQSAYVSHQMRVVSAKYACVPKKVSETDSTTVPEASTAVPGASAAVSEASDDIGFWARWGRLLSNVLPPLLGIVVLLFICYKYSGTKSPVVQGQEHQNELIKRQVELLAEQNALIERIAAALEERNKS
jgi:hypothetical protein